MKSSSIESRKKGLWCWINRLAAFFLIIALFVLSPLTAGVSAEPPMGVYCYPPPYQMSDGSLLSSPVTVDESQITTGFPQIKELTGVAMVVYWSQLCPEPDKCDFSLIDRALEYWGARGKKVILAVATIGFPIKEIVGGKADFRSGATPDWLMKKVGTYTIKSPTIGVISHVSSLDNAVYPKFWEQPFTDAVTKLVGMLSKYDGNPAISKIRISTGLLTEDNPMVGSFNAPVQGYTESIWIEFCRNMTNLYLGTFKKTALEFDIGRIPWIYVKGDASVRNSVSSFVAYLRTKRVFLAFDGLSDDLQNLLPENTPISDGRALALSYVQDFVRSGLGGGLEEMSPLTNTSRMGDVDVLVKIFNDVGATRLVSFAVTCGIMNYGRDGPNPTNATILKFVTPQRAPEVLARATKFLRLLGVSK